ncbi:hypothetical protein OS176_05880 [Xanthomonadaceae bacterium XH05]|nr:hypothetical protein [Xanthomonadaceae bacterium XH05]
MKPHEHRRWLAEQAARCMSEYAIDDPVLALRRVLSRQGAPPDRRSWPEPREILAALREYQRLFRGSAQATQLDARRATALDAMRFLASYRPRLVGAVLEGTADAHSPVQLHLHCDEPEAVMGFLQDQGISHQTSERRVQLDPQRSATVPHLSFVADSIEIELWLLPAECERHTPLAGDGRTPIPRAALGALLRQGAES